MAAQTDANKREPFIGKPITKSVADTLAPHSVEAEEALLSSLLSGCDMRAARLEELKPEHFFIVRNGWIFAAMLDIYRKDSHAKFDTIVVGERLKERGQYDEIGGLQYLEHIAMAAFAYNIGYTVREYARAIRDKATRRDMLAQADELANMAIDETTSADIQLDRHERAVKAIKPFNPGREFVLGTDSADEHEGMLREQASAQVWHPVPWDSMSERAPVVMDGDLIVIAGPEGAGKSAALMNWAQFEAEIGNKTVYIPTEMNKKTVYDRRAVANRKNIPFSRLQKPETLTDHDWDELVNTGVDLHETLQNLFYWFAGTVEEGKLFTVMQRLVDDFGVRTFVLDYLNDIVPEVERGKNEASAWRGLLARLEEFNRQNSTVIITAVQLNKEGNAYQIGRALRQKAMMLLKLNPKQLDHAAEFEYDGIQYQYLPGDFSPRVQVKVEKYRGGGRGAFDLLFVGPRYLWTDVPKDFDDGSDDPGAYESHWTDR